MKLVELQKVLEDLRQQLEREGLISSVPSENVFVEWNDGEDHEVLLNVFTGQVSAGGGRGFMWDEGKLE